MDGAVDVSVHDQRWAARVDELIMWVSERGSPSRHSEDVKERSLAQWLAEYRAHALHERRPERIKELNARLPEWRELTPPNHRSYLGAAQLIVDYFQESGTMPSLVPPLDDEQIHRAKTLRMLRRLNAQGKLPEDAAHLLNQTHHDWMGATQKEEKVPENVLTQ